MSISYNEQERSFRLDTPDSTYLINLVDEEGFLCHAYYGRRIPDDTMRYLLRLGPDQRPFRDSGQQVGLFDALPMEYPGHGLGDFRESCLSLETEEGQLHILVEGTAEEWSASVMIGELGDRKYLYTMTNRSDGSGEASAPGWSVPDDSEGNEDVSIEDLTPAE